MKKKGFIKRLGKARGIQILKGLAKPGIPVLGQIAAGQPIDVQDNALGTIQDLTLFEENEQKFALKIRGDSMINVGIMDGDLVLIQQGVHINNSEIAAVALDDGATLKRIYFEKKQVILKAENDLYEPMVVSKDHYNLALIGKYVGLIRTV